MEDSGAPLSPPLAPPGTQAIAEQLVQAVDSMQAFPVSVHNIVRLTRNPDCSPRDLVDAIGKDPIVTVKVLRVVNSAYYSLARPITTLDHAVVFLGFNTVKHLALSFAAVAMVPASPIAGFAGQSYLLHSLACAGIARQLASRWEGADPHAFFIGGLLHDFGKAVVAEAMPKVFRQASESSVWNETSLHQALLDVAQIDSAQVCALLMERWHFPQELVEAIRWQHAVQDHPAPMTVALFAANQMCKQLGVDFGGSPQAMREPEVLHSVLGATLDQVLHSEEDWNAVVSEARHFAHL